MDRGRSCTTWAENGAPARSLSTGRDGLVNPRGRRDPPGKGTTQSSNGLRRASPSIASKSEIFRVTRGTSKFKTVAAVMSGQRTYRTSPRSRRAVVPGQDPDRERACSSGRLVHARLSPDFCSFGTVNPDWERIGRCMSDEGKRLRETQFLTAYLCPALLRASFYPAGLSQVGVQNPDTPSRVPVEECPPLPRRNPSAHR